MNLTSAYLDMNRHHLFCVCQLDMKQISLQSDPMEDHLTRLALEGILPLFLRKALGRVLTDLQDLSQRKAFH